MQFLLVILLIIVGFLLLNLGLWFLVPLIVRYKRAPNYDGSFLPEWEEKHNFPQASHPQESPQLKLNIQTKRYRVNFGKNRSLDNGTVQIHYQGKVYAAHPRKGEHQLEFIEEQTKKEELSLGQSTQTIWIWQIPNTKIQCQTIFKKFVDKDYFVFEMKIDQEISGIKTGKYGEIGLKFPFFENNSANRRILTFKHYHFAPPRRNFDFVTAPVCLFDKQKNTIMISSLTQFITHGIQKIETDSQWQLMCGPNGIIDSIPADYSYECLLLFSSGIRNSFQKWGELLQQYYHATPKSRYADVVTSNLGYWTDNGAYYYYHQTKGQTMDNILEDVDNHAQQLGIPFQYYQLDSWWYRKSVRRFIRFLLGWYGRIHGGAYYGGTLTWTPDPNFLSKIPRELSQKLDNKPFIAHNRWYDIHTPRREQFEFIVEKNRAFSPDLAFWRHIMHYCQENNIRVYEQDWLSIHMWGFKRLNSEIGLADRWLTNMAQAAAEVNLTIQYCMATPSMFMQQIKYPNVTNIRASEDYNPRWAHCYDLAHFTQTSMLAYSLGIWPFKDTFQESKPGLLSYVNNPELMVLVSNLSAGPVGPGSKIGGMRPDLLLKTCRLDGKLLKPDHPLMAVDLMYLPHHSYYLTTTSSTHGAHSWYYALIMNIFPKRVSKSIYSLNDLEIDGDFIEYDWDTKSVHPIGTKDERFLQLSRDEHRYRIYAPLIHGRALIGNIDKYVVMNDIQFDQVQLLENEISFQLNGIQDEAINILIYTPDPPTEIKGAGKGANNTHYDPTQKLLFLTVTFSKAANPEIKIQF